MRRTVQHHLADHARPTPSPMVSPEALPLLPRPSGSFIDLTNGWCHSLDRFALFDTFCRIFHPQEHGFNDAHQTNYLVLLAVQFNRSFIELLLPFVSNFIRRWRKIW
jgi:hypothetical protein